MDDLYRICVKLYGPEPGVSGDLFVTIFQEWIRDRVLDMVLLDVADYAHAPASPGIMLIAHEVSFALDRADGRFGLLVQRRTPVEGGAMEAVAVTLGHAFAVANRLERDSRLAGSLNFDRSGIRIESNDRLRAPNNDEGYSSFERAVRDALERVAPGKTVLTTRVPNDPRDRLAIDVRISDEVQMDPGIAA